MARTRQIKPDFFLNEQMAETCSLGARLLFIGLWTIADREGLLEERPAKIKAQLFPYDNQVTRSTIIEWLNELAKENFIIRYSVENYDLIWIRTFKKHQHCHIKEQGSQLPDPPKDIVKPGASPVQVREKHRTSPSASTSTSTYGIRNTESGGNASHSLRAAKRRSRLSQKTGAPDEFEISDSLKEWASKTAPLVCLKGETENFLDYHRAKGNSFKDWDAAWRTWIRRAQKWTKGSVDSDGSKGSRRKDSDLHVGAGKSNGGPPPQEWGIDRWIQYVKDTDLECTINLMAAAGIDDELRAEVERRFTS